MSTKITDTEMTSDQTRHIAHVTETGSWAVSWLPGRVLTRNEAVTAMTLAEMIAVRADELADSGSKYWLFVDGWAAELGITGPHAVAEASLPPEDHEGMPRVRVVLPEPGPYGYLLRLDRAAGRALVRIDGQTIEMDACRLQYAGDAR